MSIDAALSRIDQIVGLQQQIVDPSDLTDATGASTVAPMSSTATATPASVGSATSPSGTDATSAAAFANALAQAQGSAATSDLDPSTTGTTPSLGESDDSGLLNLMSSLGTADSGASATDVSEAPDVENALAAQTFPTATEASQVTPATIPADPRVEAMQQEADSLVGKPYVYGGGHGSWAPQSGYDCSGFVSAVLHAGGYLSSPQDTTSLPSAAGMESGPGQYVTIYDRSQPGQDGHVIIDINGQFYESGGEASTWGGGGGVEKISTPSAAYLATFDDILHPAGL